MRQITLAWLAVSIGACSGDGGPSFVEGEAEAALAVAVDPTIALGSIETVGGLNYTASARFASESTIEHLERLPLRLNRLMWAGDAGPEYTDPDIVPEPEEGVWDFSMLNAGVDAMVAMRNATGADFIVTLANAPGWMSVDGSVGNAPEDFDRFAEYFARVVSYYNQGGGYTDKYGAWHEGRSVGVHYWLLWNEPDDHNWEGDTPAVGPDEFANLFVLTSAAMRAVDPTIKIGAPDTAGAHGKYLAALLDAGAVVDFVSIHRYGAGATDALMLADAEATGGVVSEALDYGIPVWVTETAPTWEDWGEKRNGSAFSLAWSPLAYASMIDAGAAVVQRWDPLYTTFSLVQDDAPLLPYWAEYHFWPAVPAGSTRVACEPSHEDLRCVATVDADGLLRIVVINRGVTDDAAVDGTGVAHDVVVTDPDGAPPGGSFEATVVDGTMDPAVGPSPVAGTGPVTIDGYGFAVFSQE